MQVKTLKFSDRLWRAEVFEHGRSVGTFWSDTDAAARQCAAEWCARHRIALAASVAASSARLDSAAAEHSKLERRIAAYLR